jgi:hypothetical protein
MSAIACFETRDVRFPIGAGHGSDAIHKDPVYSYAVTLLRDAQGRPSRASSSRWLRRAQREEKAETGKLKAEGIQNSASSIQN